MPSYVTIVKYRVAVSLYGIPQGNSKKGSIEGKQYGGTSVLIFYTYVAPGRRKNGKIKILKITNLFL